MTDIASLSIEINSTQVKEGKESFKDFGDEVLRTTDDVDAFQKKMNDNASFQKQQEAMAKNREVMKEIPKDVQKILDKYDPLGTKLRQLQSDFAALDKVAAGGGFSAGNDKATEAAYAGINAEIAKTQGLMIAAGAAGAEGFGKAGVAAMNLGLNTAHARRELVIMGREALSGEFSRLPNTFASLVAHSNLMSVLFNPITLGIVALVATIGVLGVAYAKGAAEMEEMNKAMEITSNFAGQTRGSMLQLADSVARTSTLTIGTSKEIVTALVESGRIGVASIGSIARLVDDFANATGQHADKAAKELLKIFEDPAKGAAELNKQFHFLSAAELDNLEHLQRLGKETEAQLILSQKLSDFLPSHVDNLGKLERAWNSVKKAASEAWNVMGGGGEKSPEEQLKSAQEWLKMQQSLPARLQDPDKIRAAQQKVNDLAIEIIAKQDKAARDGVRAEEQKRDIATDNLAKQHSKYAEIQKIVDEISRLDDWETKTPEQAIYQAESLKELRKKKDDLVNPNDLLKGTDVSLRKKADEDIKRVNEWAAQDESRTLQGIQAINEIEDAYDKATGAYADREKKKREEIAATKQAEKEAHEMGAFQENEDANRMIKNSNERVKHEGQIAKFDEATKERIDQLRQEATKYGDTAREIALAAEARKLENEYTKAAKGLSAEELEALNKLYEARKKQIAAAAEGKVLSQAVEAENKRIADAEQKVWDNFIKNVQHTLGDQLYQTMLGNFKNIGQAFYQMLQRMLADALAANIMNSIFSGGRSSMANQGLNVLTHLFAPTPAGPNVAKGAWFDGGQSNFEYGGIFDNPTSFAFNNGGRMSKGTMGEAGPETILPLKRDSSGKLGVSASGGGKSVSVVYAPQVSIDGTADRAQSLAMMDKMIKQGHVEFVEQLSRAGLI